MPVLPAVPSTTAPPGRTVPRLIASRMMNSAARSFTDWPGLMNSALPRMLQPVSSEARFSLMRGVRAIASTTSLLVFICGKSCRSVAKSGNDPRARSAKVEAFCAQFLRCKLLPLREHPLADVDISRQESGLAISEVIFPQPPEPVVEAERHQV